MRIFLSGLMGSGKSSLCAHVARRLGLPGIDLDVEIARHAGESVPEIFTRRGEAGFRALEREVLGRVLAREEALVLALGGGTVTDTDTRRRLLDAGLLITLEASPETLSARVGAGEGRPLLAGAAVRERLADLLASRQDAYAECHARVSTEGQSLEALADTVAALVEQPPLVVPLGIRTYRITVGEGVRSSVAAQLPGASSVVLVTDTHVRAPWAADVAGRIEAAGLRVTRVVLEAGEAHKHASSVQRIWDAALDAGIDRDAWVVAVGGGVVGDLAGFAAATLLRGVRVGHVPTTLLAMVDSAVGGKTGFDTPHGKNLIGAFHQPAFVLCDVETLDTLPLRERRAGLAEVAKSAWLTGEQAVADLEADAAALVAGDRRATERAVRMSVRLKARIVTEDEREAGNRAWLNLGHTVGHAIEAAQGYRGMLHGEAVALGMCAAFRVAQHLGYGSATHARRAESLLRNLGLPVDVDRYLDDRTLAFIGSDKKRQGGKVRFVVPAAPGDVRLVPVALDELPSLVAP